MTNTRHSRFPLTSQKSNQRQLFDETFGSDSVPPTIMPVENAEVTSLVLSDSQGEILLPRMSTLGVLNRDSSSAEKH